MKTFQEESLVHLMDMHCHVDLYSDPPAIIQECENLGIRTIAVTTTPKAWPQNCAWTKDSKFVKPALGLHPQVISERADEIVIFEKYISEARYIGEIGLDASPAFKDSMPMQIKIFQRILKLCAEAGGKVLSIHAVRTVKETLELLERHFPKERGVAIFHWFSGTLSQAKKAIEQGCYFSINGRMLSSENQLKIISNIPINRILIETDGPFVKINGEPIRPIHAGNINLQLSRHLRLTEEKLKEHLNCNLKQLLNESLVSITDTTTKDLLDPQGTSS